jgi:hypothetical protein
MEVTGRKAIALHVSCLSTAKTARTRPHVLPYCAFYAMFPSSHFLTSSVAIAHRSRRHIVVMLVLFRKSLDIQIALSR